MHSGWKEITKIPFELPDTVLKVLEGNSSFVKFKKNKTIIDKGSKEQYVFFICGGIARLFYPASVTNKNREETIAFGQPGDIAASVTTFMHGQPAIFSFGAVTEVSAYKVPSNVIKKLTASSHIFCDWMLKTALWQLSGLEVRYMFISIGDAYERFLNFMSFKPAEFIKNIPLKYIASYINVSPQTLSELRARYAKDVVKMRFDKNTPYIDIVSPSE